MNPRRAGLGLWGFGILADAERGGVMPATCPPTRFVAVAVRGLLGVCASVEANGERWGVSCEIKRDIG